MQALDKNNYTLVPPPRIVVNVSFFYTIKYSQMLSPLLYAVISDARRGVFCFLLEFLYISEKFYIL